MAWFGLEGALKGPWARAALASPACSSPVQPAAVTGLGQPQSSAKLGIFQFCLIEETWSNMGTQSFHLQPCSCSCFVEADISHQCTWCFKRIGQANSLFQQK